MIKKLNSFSAIKVFGTIYIPAYSIAVEVKSEKPLSPKSMLDSILSTNVSRRIIISVRWRTTVKRGTHSMVPEKISY